MEKSVHEAQSAFQQSSKALQHLPHDAANAARGFANEMAGDASELIGSATECMGSFRTSVTEKIRAKPLQAMGIAIGAGCLLGMIMARRRR